MKIEEQTGSRSAAESESHREPWEPYSVREEIALLALFLAERVCYRVAFLLSGACNQVCLAAGDLLRERRNRIWSGLFFWNRYSWRST